jgi:Ca-activated chloride channel family protein
MIEFSYPWLFIALLLPLLLVNKQSSGAALSFAALAAVARESAQPSKSRFRKHSWWFWGFWCLVVVAASGPKYMGEPEALPQQGRDLMMAIDLSGSMNNMDMEIEHKQVNRIDAVKYVVTDFIARRQGDRLGLILFADAAYQQTPLTFDLKTVQTMLNEAELGLVGQRTAIGEAIGLAVKRFNNLESSNKVLVLLSDGANTVNTVPPLEALKLAKAAGVRIYSIGLGSDQPQQDAFGLLTLAPTSDLDEKLLQQLSSETGGRYFRARDLQQLQEIYQLLDKLEPIERDKLTVRPQQSLLHYPLLAALFILLIRIAMLWRRPQDAD